MSRPRKAWVIVPDASSDRLYEQYFPHLPKGQPSAVLPTRTPDRVVLAAVNVLVQSTLFTHPSDQEDYLRRRGAPYTAKQDMTGEIIAGHNPYFEAFRVNDLLVVTNDDDGSATFTFTRPPYVDFRARLEEIHEQSRLEAEARARRAD